MLIVWKGKGFVVAVVMLAAVAAAQLAADGIGGAGTYAANSYLCAGLALVGAGGMLTWWGQRLKTEARQFIFDPKTNEPVVLGHRNTMFFLPVHVWGMVCLAGGACLAAAGIVL